METETNRVKPIPAKRKNLPKSPSKDNATSQSFFGRPPPPVPVKQEIASDVPECEYTELPDTEISNHNKPQHINDHPTKEKKKDKKLINLFKSQNSIPLAKSDTKRYTKKKEKHSKPAPANTSKQQTKGPEIKEETNSLTGEDYEVLPGDIEEIRSNDGVTTQKSIQRNLSETTSPQFGDALTKDSQISKNKHFHQRAGMKMLDINTQALRNVKLKSKPTTADVFNTSSSKEDDSCKTPTYPLPKLKPCSNVGIQNPSYKAADKQDNTHNSGSVEQRSLLDARSTETSNSHNITRGESSKPKDLPARKCLANDKPPSRNMFNRPPPPTPPDLEGGQGTAFECTELPDSNQPPPRNIFNRPPPPTPPVLEDGQGTDLEYSELPADLNQDEICSPPTNSSNQLKLLNDDESQLKEVNSNCISPQMDCESNKNNNLPEETKFSQGNDHSSTVSGISKDEMSSQNSKLAMDSYKWFHGGMSRKDAENRILEANCNQNGHFLVRKSVKGGLSNPYTLCLNFNGIVKNLHIRQRCDKKYAIGVEKPDEVTFVTVPEMISYHQQNAIVITGNNEQEGGNVILTND